MVVGSKTANNFENSKLTKAVEIVPRTSSWLRLLAWMEGQLKEYYIAWKS